MMKVSTNCHGNAGNGQRHAIFDLELGASDHHLPHLRRGFGGLGFCLRLWVRRSWLAWLTRLRFCVWVFLTLSRVFTAKHSVFARPTLTHIRWMAVKTKKTLAISVYTLLLLVKFFLGTAFPNPRSQFSSFFDLISRVFLCCVHHLTQRLLFHGTLR